MKLTKLLAIAAVIGGVLAGNLANAQRWPVQNRDRNYRYDNRNYRNNRGIQDLVARTERESNSFRDYFEHNYRDRGHGQRYDPREGHGDHEGRYGQMTLRDAIQNLDEAMERLRRSVGRNDSWNRDTQEVLDDVMEHSNDVDERIGRVSDSYDFNRQDRWNGGYNNGYNQREFDGDLSSRWRRLRADIRDIDRAFGRGR